MKEDGHPQRPYYEPVGDLMLQIRTEEIPPLRALEEEATRLSSSSDEAVLDASLS